MPGRHFTGDGQRRGFAAADFYDHASRDMCTPISTFGIDTAFEPVARIRHDAELAPAGRYSYGIKQGHFEEYVGGIIADPRPHAAHDAADALDTLIISDHRHGGI